jgi:hypothetical protein
VSAVWALVLAGVPPAVGVVVGAARRHTVDVVGVIVIAGLLVNAALALISRSPRAILLDGAATTAAFAVACWVSLLFRRPLIFHFAQTFYGGPSTADGAELDEEYEQFAQARAYWRTVTLVWGVVYVVEAVALVVVIRAAGVGTALATNRVVPWAVTGCLFAWALTWAARLRAEKPSGAVAED